MSTDTHPSVSQDADAQAAEATEATEATDIRITLVSRSAGCRTLRFVSTMSYHRL